MFPVYCCTCFCMGDLGVQVYVSLSIRPFVCSSVHQHLLWVSCEHSSSYSFVPIVLKLCRCFHNGMRICMWFGYTGDSRYVDFAYLDNITYVEVIFHSQHFFSIYLCISIPSMSKTVNMKQRVSQGDFSCPRRFLYYFSYCLCRSQKSALARALYCLLRLCICITWGAKSFKQLSKTKWYNFFRKSN